MGTSCLTSLFPRYRVQGNSVFQLSSPEASEHASQRLQHPQCWLSEWELGPHSEHSGPSTFKLGERFLKPHTLYNTMWRLAENNNELSFLQPCFFNIMCGNFGVMSVYYDTMFYKEAVGDVHDNILHALSPLRELSFKPTKNLFLLLSKQCTLIPHAKLIL